MRQCLTGLSPYEEKFNAVKAKNPAFETLLDYYHILKVDQFEVATDTPEDAVAFKFAPMVNVGIERFFSEFNTLLSANRHSCTVENLKNHCIWKYNA